MALDHIALVTQRRVATTIRANPPDDKHLWCIVLACGGAGLRIVSRAAVEELAS